MKNHITTFIILCIAILVSCNCPKTNDQDYFIKNYLERLENSRKYLILVADAMPEDKYSFKASPEIMSFEEHLMHIAWAMDCHS